MEELRLYCIVSRQAWKLAKGVPGKMVAQGGHAFCGALCDALVRFPDRFKEYQESAHHPKITIMADDEEIRELHTRYKQKFGTAIITDAGRTVFEGPTLTALGIGPILPSEREEMLSGMRPW